MPCAPGLQRRPLTEPAEYRRNLLDSMHPTTASRPVRAAARRLVLACMVLASPVCIGDVRAEDAAGSDDVPTSAARPRSSTAPVVVARQRQVPVLDELPASDAGTDASLADLAAWNRAGVQPPRTAFSRALGRPRTIRLRGRALRSVARDHEQPAAMLLGSDADTVVWTSSIRVRDAHGLKLALRQLSLPPGSALWAYGTDRVPQGP